MSFSPVSEAPALDRFAPALACVLRQEGGWADHPLDPGGPTQRGITLATLAAARGRPVSPAELRAMSPQETAAIYRARYWDAVQADALPAGVDLCLFDIAVHSGPRRAALLLQAELGVPQDGVIGPVTLAAATARDPAALIPGLGRRRLAMLRGLAGWTPFGRGWSRRVAEVERESLALASTAPPPAFPPPPAPPTASPPPEKDASMPLVKSILLSRTVWANLIGLAAFGLSSLGFNTAGLDAGGLADALLQGITALSFVASTFFRIVATHQLAKAG